MAFCSFEPMKSLRPFIVLSLLCVAVGIGCREASISGNSPIPVDEPFVLALPKGFPMPNIPADNALTKNRVALGKMLFAEKLLSGDSTQSCASCHKGRFGYGDSLAVSPGIKGAMGDRNAPVLFNTAYHPYFFKEGGSPTLEMQVLGPIQNPVEMAADLNEVIRRLNQQKDYKALAKIAYGRDSVDAFVLTRAIAAYERTLISGNSNYDRYVHGNDTTVLSAEEKKGMALFFSSRTRCSECHAGNDFSTYEILNNGSKTDYTTDPGLFRRTGKSGDIGKFKMPSLRNVAFSAPYMHDGSYATLEDVITQYNKGGSGHANQDARIQPLQLTAAEQADLVAFLKSLSDEKLLLSGY